MAYRDNDKREHPYKKIAKEIKSGEVKNLLFFYGKEQYLVTWAIDTLIQKYINPVCKELDLTRLDGTTVNFEELQNTCETLPLMSEKKVVVVSNFKVAEGSFTKFFGEADEKKLISYLETLPTECLLIFTAETTDKRKKIFKAIKEFGSEYDFYNLDESQLKGFIEKRIKSAGKIARPNVIRTFMDMTGYYDKDTDYTLYNVENDIKKMISYSQGEELFLADVAVAVSGNLDTDVFAMIDALSRDRKDEAFLLLHNQLRFGENVYKLLALICSQFEIILAVKELKDRGCSLEQIKADLKGVHEFRIKKASTFAERYTIKHLKYVLQKAYEVDKNIKSGLLESSLALEMLIASV